MTRHRILMQITVTLLTYLVHLHTSLCVWYVISSDLGVLCYVTVWIYRLLGITAWLLLLILATTVAACRGKTRGMYKH